MDPITTQENAIAPVTVRAALLLELRQGPGSGLDLDDRLRERTRGCIDLGGAIYTELRDLERDGLVTSWEGESLPERGYRPRRYYRLTDRGVREAERQARILYHFYRLHEYGVPAVPTVRIKAVIWPVCAALLAFSGVAALLILVPLSGQSVLGAVVLSLVVYWAVRRIRRLFSQVSGGTL